MRILMSKEILKKKKIMDILLSSLVGEEAPQKYASTDGEWIDGEKNILFIPFDSEDHSSPPVLVSVQYTVDKSFIHCLTREALHIYDRYKREPVVLTLCIEDAHANVVSNFSDSSVPYMKILPSAFWAEKHCIITPATLTYYLHQECNTNNNNVGRSPMNINNNNTNSIDSRYLPPLAAVALVLTSQKQTSPEFHHYKNDPTVRLCREIYDNERREHKASADVYVKAATQTQTQFKRILEQVNQNGTNMRKRIKELSNEGIAFTETCLHKLGEEEQIISASPPTPHSAHRSTSSSNVSVAISPLSSDMTDMEFVNHWKHEYMKTHKRMDWVACFEEGRQTGLLSTYKNLASLKNTYNKKYPSS